MLHSALCVRDQVPEEETFSFCRICDANKLPWDEIGIIIVPVDCSICRKNSSDDIAGFCKRAVLSRFRELSRRSFWELVSFRFIWQWGHVTRRAGVLKNDLVPKLLFFKERFLAADHPDRGKMDRFSAKLRKPGLREETVGHGMTREAWELPQGSPPSVA